MVRDGDQLVVPPNEAIDMRTGAATSIVDTSLRKLIWSDVQLWAEMFSPTRESVSVGVLTAIWLGFSYSGLRATLLYRLAHAAHQRRFQLVPSLLANLNLVLHGFDMPSHVPVGPRFYVPHPVGTVVTARSLGANVTLVSAVTIGMRRELEFPAIGDSVYIGAGARVLGGITIGDRVQIGANAVVIRDVPNDCVAVGVPATVRPGSTRSEKAGQVDLRVPG
jgi:serine O-acetyltransferase